eukprot:scaffold169570_cov23-Cyclotella_meneghiniana.AAC.1
MIVGCIHGGTLALFLVWGRVVAGLFDVNGLACHVEFVWENGGIEGVVITTDEVKGGWEGFIVSDWWWGWWAKAESDASSVLSSFPGG